MIIRGFGYIYIYDRHIESKYLYDHLYYTIQKKEDKNNYILKKKFKDLGCKY